MDALRFADPWMLVLLALVPALLWLARLRRRSGVVRVGSIAAASGASRTWRTRLEPTLFVLRLVAVAALVVALARPQRGEAGSRARGEGIDIVLVYDVSSSMTQPFSGRTSRLEAAEAVLTDFIRQRENDRVGLVAFQGSSITLSPLTTDYDALAESAREADRLSLADGTAIGTALGSSINVLRGSSASSRIVILLTDGENNAGATPPLAAARIAERLGVRVYSVGIVGGTFRGIRSTAEIDEEALKKISEVTGGFYSRATDPEQLAGIYAGIDDLEKSRIAREGYTRYDEFVPYVLALAAAALLAELALRATLLRRAT